MDELEALKKKNEELQKEADAKQAKLDRVARYIFGALLLVKSADEIMAWLIRAGESKT